MMRALATVLQKTDHRRWSDPTNLESWWEPRTERAAALIPAGSRVIEFGAGNRTLERVLDPSCTYVPSDIVDRGPGTLVCNLNERPLPNLGSDVYDVAVMMGVLEYMRDAPSIVDWLAEHVQVCVLSYVCAEENRFSIRGARSRLRRIRAGWMNNFRDDELRSLFDERGFHLLQEEICLGNRLFVFSRRADRDR